MKSRTLRRVGIYGGTFDPPHIGHLLLALLAREARELDEVLLIPSAVSPFKTEERHSSVEDRLAMTELAAEENDGLHCSDIEIRAGGVSYTVDTVRRLANEYGEIELIIGDDQLAEFHKWREPETILELATVVSLPRRGVVFDREANPYVDRAVRLDAPIVELSSTAVRERVRRGLPITFWTTDSVRAYIEKRGLYR
ncbi:MAG: nicotinate (nicotinamide) nucleotide adenylyltransferase [Ignavibacteriales bacterium]|nr:nicotinate (nicotinamide) nucleotide adenylyltransferase [Ignavibacteriales bacterium]